MGRNRNVFGDGINTKEILANLLDFPQVLFNVLTTQKGDVKPEMIAIAGGNPLALSHVLGHAPGNNVPGGQLFFAGLVVGHEPVAVLVKAKVHRPHGSLRW